MVYQNQIILSQTLKPSFDERFIELRNKLELTDRFPFHPTKRDIKGINILSEVTQTYLDLAMKNAEFQKDTQSYYDGVKFSMGYYQTRSYWLQLLFLANFTIYPSLDYDQISTFLLDVDKSKLIEDEKADIRRKVKEYLVRNYMVFIEKNEHDMTIFSIPNIFFPDQEGLIDYVQLHRAPYFRKYYDLFEKYLGRIT